jgi:hypothetical protein
MPEIRRARSIHALVWIALVAVSAHAAPAGAASAQQAPPRLGRIHAPSERGYGQVRPAVIFNGGDPTGLVQHIHWSGWGTREAIGTGDAEYVWPGTCVACNGLSSGARVVAFRLGVCRGHRSYNALTWFFPKYGETFDPHQYIDTCTGAYVGDNLKETACPNARLAEESTVATEVKAIKMSCAEVDRLISASPAKQYARNGGRFEQAGFRCGTEGAAALGSALFDCQAGEREFLYWIAS